MYNQLKEIRCLVKLNEDYTCGRWLGDMECYEHTKTYPCKRCGVVWEVAQSDNGTLTYRKVSAKNVKKDYDKSGVIVVEG